MTRNQWERLGQVSTLEVTTFMERVACLVSKLFVIFVGNFDTFLQQPSTKQLPFCVLVHKPTESSSRKFDRILQSRNLAKVVSEQSMQFLKLSSDSDGGKILQTWFALKHLPWIFIVHAIYVPSLRQNRLPFACFVGNGQIRILNNVQYTSKQFAKIVNQVWSNFIAGSAQKKLNAQLFHFRLETAGQECKQWKAMTS